MGSCATAMLAKQQTTTAAIDDEMLNRIVGDRESVFASNVGFCLWCKDAKPDL